MTGAPTPKRWAILISCEHGGNAIPEWLSDRVAIPEEVLESHRGWDPGAKEMALNLCMGFGCDRMLASTTRYVASVSRLIVDLNRSADSPSAFSEFTRDLSGADRKRILHDHYRPYRERVESAARASIDQGHLVIHVSVHTFTPVLGTDRRDYHAGVLFDPGRVPEAHLAHRWIETMRECGPTIDVRANKPYLGTDDGLTTTLRTVFGPDDYIGIETEVRNDLAGDDDAAAEWGARLAASLNRALRR